MKNEVFYELTNPQKAIWFTEQFYKNTPIANVSGSYIMDEIVNFELLDKAINFVIKNNDAFNLRISIRDGIPVQSVVETSPIDIDIDIVDLKDETSLPELEDKLTLAPFTLLDSPLFRVTMFRFKNNHGGFIFVANHIIADAWTAGLINTQIAECYSSLLNNTPFSINDYSYLDFIKAEENYIASEKFQKDKLFWENDFSGMTDFAFLCNNSKDKFATCEANRYLLKLNDDIANKINNFCTTNKTSFFSVFMSIFGIYLSRISRLNDVVIETPVLNRTNFNEKHCLGMFISTIPFKISIPDNATFKEFLTNVMTKQITYFRHQKYPYELLLSSLREKNGFSSNMYDVAISYQNARNNSQTSDLKYHTHWNFNRNISNSLEIHITDLDGTGNYNLIYDYQVSKFDEDEIVQLNNRLLHILDQVLSNIETPLNDIDIVTPEEKQKLLYDFNNNVLEYDTSKTLVDYFEEQVVATPNNIAVCHGDENLTYIELSRLVDAISIEINKLGLNNSRIAVFANKSFKVLASFIAIMKTGNAYIPVDPTYPDERIKYILQDSGCRLIIGHSKFLQKHITTDSICLDKISPYTGEKIKVATSPDNLAYIIYTSGTTGKPKGVQIKHKNVINTLLWRKNFYNFDSSISVLQIPSFSFDSSVEDTFVPLISGGRLVFSTSEKMDINSLCEQIEKHEVNHILAVPSVYKILLREKSEYLKDFKFITIAGESFNIKLVKEHFEKLPNVRLVNEYGPTENSICSTVHEFSPNDTRVYIGKPIANTKCYILDNSLNLLPIGVSGELYVTGPGVSAGYINREDLTKKVFVKSKFSDDVLYSTGDVVTINSDGNLEFVARNDSQIKLNGLRIELQEIDEAILAYPHISDSVTLVRENNIGRKQLISYITASKQMDSTLLINYLRTTLPYYMMPTVMILDKLPLTPNGKIDKQKLPLPKAQEKRAVDEPVTKFEQSILDVCRSVLGNKTFDVTDDFFTDGLADSLTILTLSSRLFALDIKAQTQDFYKYSNVRSLATFLQDAEAMQNKRKHIIKMKYQTNSNDISSSLLDFNFKNVLLTGVTGFLGSHILCELLEKTSCNVYCLIRAKQNASIEERFKRNVDFYFGKDFYDNYKGRVVLLDGNLSYDKLGLSDENYKLLEDNVDCIIHSAAVTKHYGNYDVFYRENYIATKNIISLAKKNNVVLNYMSTTTVSGNYLVHNDISTTFTENDFYIGQNYDDNVYVKSKFEAEKMIFEQQHNGLNANIFRLGNLMARTSDGVFQKNKLDNAYYTRLIAFAKIGIIPKEFENKYMEFTPIDDTARAIITLLSVPNLKNKVFHLFNNNIVTVRDVIDIIESIGVHCSFEETSEFLEALHKNHDVMKYIVSDFDKNQNLRYYSDINVTNDITEKILSKLGFNWTVISADYILKMLRKNNFIEDTKENYEKY